MNDNTNVNYQSLVKKAWIIYSVITLAVILVLVFLVAADTEEQFFFTIMPAAAAYVFRPGEKLLGKWIFKFTGVARPTEDK